MVRALSRWVAYGLTALAGGIGLWLLGMGLRDQCLRLALDLTQGLGFADPGCTTGYCDYTMFWLAGDFTRHGAGGLIYGHADFARAAAVTLPYRTGYWPFVYPPFVLLPAVALSLAPLVPGYYAFCAIAMGLSAWLLRKAGIAWWCILLGLLSPAAMWNLYLGQFGLLCGALLVFGLARLERWPVEAGLVLALLCIKPQYALLVPVVVLAGGHRRALAAGVCGVAAMLAGSIAVGGVGVWNGYLGPGRAVMRQLLEQDFGGFQVMGTSMFWMARSLGLGLPDADAVQAGVSALAALAVAWLWRKPAADAARRITLTVFWSLLASPYGFTDDLAVYAVLLPTLARRGAPWRNAVLAGLWVAPAFVPKFVAAFGFLPTPLLVLAALGLAQQKQPLFSEQIGQRGGAAPGRA